MGKLVEHEKARPGSTDPSTQDDASVTQHLLVPCPEIEDFDLPTGAVLSTPNVQNLCLESDFPRKKRIGKLFHVSAHVLATKAIPCLALESRRWHW